MAKADKYAEEANVKGIRNINFLEMAVLGCLFGVLAVAGLYGGTALGETLKDFSYQFSWVMAGLDAAGGAMKFVGFAILMKVMMSGEMWGFLLAGFAMALICAANASTAGATLLLCAFVGAAIAIYDFTTQTKIKQNAGAGAVFREPPLRQDLSHDACEPPLSVLLSLPQMRGSVHSPQMLLQYNLSSIFLLFCFILSLLHSIFFLSLALFIYHEFIVILLLLILFIFRFHGRSRIFSRSYRSASLSYPHRKPL